MLRQVLFGGLLPRLLAHNTRKRMYVMLKPITNYELSHSLTIRLETAFSATDNNRLSVTVEFAIQEHDV